LAASTNWTWGARPDPLWNPHLEGFEGRVARHESWEACRDALMSEGRRVHDFYFQISEGEVCDACGGTGYGRDYAEFLVGFHVDGGGRWAGWGSQPFPSAEFALLCEVLPGHVDAAIYSLAEPETLSYEQELLVKETVGPMRAAALGVVSDCERCAGGLDGFDELLVWSFGSAPDTGRIDVVRFVEEEDHKTIRAFMAEAFAKIERRLMSSPGRIGWDANEKGFAPDAGAWFMRSERCATFGKFQQGIGAADARNLLFDVHVVPTTPGRCLIRLWMTHPARGYGREILVEDASRDDAEELAKILSDHYAVHRRNFGWALASGPVDGNADDGRELLTHLMKKG
jgi:hypothetical protein